MKQSHDPKMAGVSAAAISALAGCISAGTSVAGTTLNAVLGGVDYNVACGVEVSNWTKFLMEDPCVSAHGGLIKTPPVLVLPGEKEIMVSKQQHVCISTNLRLMDLSSTFISNRMSPLPILCVLDGLFSKF